MEKSQSIKAIAAALLTFQSNMAKIKKDSANPFYKSKYASLSTILEHIQTPLADSGLSFAQFPDGNQLTTILMHAESGDWMQSSYDISPVKSDPQSIGSAITYARRYALGAILGLNIDEDDDGNAATGKTDKAATPDLPWLNKDTDHYKKSVEWLKSNPANMVDKLRQAFKISKEVEALLLKEAGR
jgi:hypothetical protein